MATSRRTASKAKASRNATRKTSPSVQPRPSNGAARAARTPPARGKERRGPSARAPVGADELKVRLGRLATARGRIKTLQRSMSRSFLEIGHILSEIEVERLHEAKGYGSFEAFLDREVDLGVRTGMRLVRAARTFRPEAAQAAGLDRTLAALDVLEGHAEAASGATEGAGPAVGPALPPHKR